MFRICCWHLGSRIVRRWHQGPAEERDTWKILLPAGSFLHCSLCSIGLVLDSSVMPHFWGVLEHLIPCPLIFYKFKNGKPNGYLDVIVVILCMCVLPAYMSMYHVCLMPIEARRQDWISWNWSYRLLWPPYGCRKSSPPKSSGKVAYALKWWVISPAPIF